jgi:hypothetical protein
VGSRTASRTDQPANNCVALSNYTLLKLRLACLAAVLFWATAASAQTISIQFDGSTFRVAGWSAPSAAPAKGWGSVFSVYAGTGDVPPLAGSYTFESNVLVFHPTYPIAPGVHYRAVFQPPAGGAAIEKTFDGPAQNKTLSARVEHVYPSADVLPSNQLRLYIYFSAPMSRSESARYIHVLDENGKVLEGAHAVFLPGEELWDPNFQRLTMTFDPGRIKRGLTSNERIGPPIAEGKRYTLVIDREWPDAHGATMVEGFRKIYRGGPPERKPPDPKQWRVTSPKAGTVDALVIDFPTAMNYPLLQRMIQVSGGRDKLTGTVSVARGETEWRFTPHEPWEAGDYQLIVDTAIEDLAGNHIGQPFDIDTFEHVTEHIATNTVSLPFAIR